MASDEECNLAEVTSEDTGTQRIIDDMENTGQESLESLEENIPEDEESKLGEELVEDISSDIELQGTSVDNDDEDNVSDQAFSEDDVENDKLECSSQVDSPVCLQLSETKMIDENDNDELEKSIQIPTYVQSDADEPEQSEELRQDCNTNITTCVALGNHITETNLQQTHVDSTENTKTNVVTSVDAFEFHDDEEEMNNLPIHHNDRYFRLKSTMQPAEHAHISKEKPECGLSVIQLSEHISDRTEQSENGLSPEQHPEKEPIERLPEQETDKEPNGLLPKQQPEPALGTEVNSNSAGVSEKFQNKDSIADKAGTAEETEALCSKCPILEKTLNATKKSDSEAAIKDLMPIANSKKPEVCSAFSVSNKANYLSKLLQELRESKQEHCSSSSTISSMDMTARSAKAEKIQMKSNGVMPPTTANHKTVNKSEKLYFQASDSRNVKSSIENVIPPKVDYVASVKDKRHNGLIESDSSMKQNKFRAQQPVSTKAENYSDYMRMLASTCVQPSM